MEKKNGFTQVANRFLDYMASNNVWEMKIYCYLSKWRNYSGDGYVEASISTIMKHIGTKKRSIVTNTILSLVEKRMDRRYYSPKGGREKRR
jgi:hypothetical protein